MAFDAHGKLLGYVQYGQVFSAVPLYLYSPGGKGRPASEFSGEGSLDTLIRGQRCRSVCKEELLVRRGMKTGVVHSLLLLRSGGTVAI